MKLLLDNLLSTKHLVFISFSVLVYSQTLNEDEILKGMDQFVLALYTFACVLR